jgi:hypothetical protein
VDRILKVVCTRGRIDRQRLAGLSAIVAYTMVLPLFPAVVGHGVNGVDAIDCRMDYMMMTALVHGLGGEGG